MVREHNSAGANPDCGCLPGDVANQDRGRGAPDSGHVMVFGQPEAGVAPALGVLSQIHGGAEGFGERAICFHRSQIENREFRTFRAGHSYLDDLRSRFGCIILCTMTTAARAVAATMLYFTALFPLSAADCDALARAALPETITIAAEAVPAGTFDPPYGNALEKLPAFCRVTGVSKPTKDSFIRFEVWLPTSGWNGKYLGLGNGGFAGSIDYGGMARALKGGYATAATNTGHDGESVDATWAFGHPEKVSISGIARCMTRQ